MAGSPWGPDSAKGSFQSRDFAASDFSAGLRFCPLKDWPAFLFGSRCQRSPRGVALARFRRGGRQYDAGSRQFR
jgi:hypothetical protein